MLRLSLIIAFLFYSQASFAQNSIEQYDTEYNRLKGQALTMPKNFDFQHMRDVYAKTSYYKPYGVDPRQDFKKFFEAADKGDKTIIPLMEEYIDKNFALGMAHVRAIGVYKAFNMEEKRHFSDWAARGFLKAVNESGNPLDPDNAPKVLIIPEEYMIARQYIEKVEGQSVLRGDNNIYDVLSGASKDNGETIKLYFNTNYIWQVEDPW